VTAKPPQFSPRMLQAARLVLEWTAERYVQERETNKGVDVIEGRDSKAMVVGTAPHAMAASGTDVLLDPSGCS
jgi:hypothetical protein